VGYELQPGAYRLESFEPYTLRYLKLNVLQGDCEVTDLYLREYANDETSLTAFACSDPRLTRIFDAARQTFRQNAVDIFMDCPRASGRLAVRQLLHVARGVRPVRQHDYREELLRELPVAAEFCHLPEGMLPMCYPPTTTTASTSRTGRCGS